MRPVPRRVHNGRERPGVDCLRVDVGRGDGPQPRARRGDPGIETARRRIRAHERLCTGNYLKAATSQGLHGFYRTLATDARVIDLDGALNENGEQLILAWEADQGLSGFLTDGVQVDAFSISFAKGWRPVWLRAPARRHRPARRHGVWLTTSSRRWRRGADGSGRHSGHY